MDIFGLGKAGSTAILVVAALAVAGTATKCTIDFIGDKREAELRRDSAADRLRNQKERKDLDDKLQDLPRRAKIWCAARRTQCCAAGAVGLPECTADPDAP